MKTKVFGGVMGAAMALTGCMGATGATTAELAWVPADVDGRTDLFLVGDHLAAASELAGAVDAIPVEVDVTDWTLTATRLGTTEIVGTWQALDVVDAADLAGVTPIDGELNPGDGPIVVPGSEFPRFGRGYGTVPGPSFDNDGPGLIIDWSERLGGIPDSTDVELYEGLQEAHPGCA